LDSLGKLPTNFVVDTWRVSKERAYLQKVMEIFKNLLPFVSSAWNQSKVCPDGLDMVVP
jgi:hypothetical protein